MMSSSRNHQRASAGYTLIEIMMALGIMTMGAVGIMGLHQASTHANLSARELSTANNVLRTWMERLKRDALLWNLGGNGALAANLTLTNYLQEIGNGWVVPDPPDDFESHAFNHFGMDTNVNDDMRFCTNIRIVWVAPGQSIRTEVRVWWPRRGANAGDYAACGAGTDPESLTNDPNLHFVSAASVVRWYPL